ncbi:PRTRC system protein B [Pedobacter frigoris]|uniref:PRTRC system protein B n=1 Tax=Pedobacter frigoris TaxID=2571272 RepID=UPI00292F2FE0|nr:PRTRC system protein B [Pedobacter frigoris]
MNAMTNLMPEIEQLFVPVQSLVIYRQLADRNNIYVEVFDIGKDGCPLNPHPLTTEESIAFARSLADSKELNSSFLRCEGLLPENVLYLDTSMTGTAVWFTPAFKTNLFFKAGLTIPNGEAFIPPLLWRASRNRLHLYALPDNNRPTEKTKLLRAPFFNTGESGSVCMGTVNVKFDEHCTLQKFITQWQHFFFNSYFSHLSGSNPVSCNIVQLWQQQVATGQPFPMEVLISSNQKLNDLIL